MQRFQLLHRLQGRRKRQAHRAIYIQRGVQMRVLLQIPAGHAAAESGLPFVWLALAIQNTQKGRLAGTVGADNADAVAALHAGVDIL